MHKDLPPLSLYIHWPFCLSKCPYCDFNSHVRQSIDIEKWQVAFMQELHRAFEQTGPRALVSIFFGGGTPSLMAPSLVEKIIETASHLWQPTDNIEISLEANPNSVEVEKFAALQKAGVNRVSIGIQALNDRDLKVLGRQHSAIEAKQAIHIATRIFPRVSFDLIYARPDQTLPQWRQELSEAFEYGTEHLSLYQLTIEPGTAFAPLYARGELIIPEDDLAADLYELTQAETAAVGLRAYEVSNHAREGGQCQHNLVYWRYGDYVGVGPGAHGRFSGRVGGKVATKQFRAPETWLNHVLSHQKGEEERLSLSPQEQGWEMLMMGLRLQEVIYLDTLPQDPTLLLDLESLSFLSSQGLLTYDGSTLSCTSKGWLKLNAILKKILK